MGQKEDRGIDVFLRCRQVWGDNRLDLRSFESTRSSNWRSSVMAAGSGIALSDLQLALSFHSNERNLIYFPLARLLMAC
jgi:hypothetical protein